MLGITVASKRRATTMDTEAAEVASRWLWIRWSRVVGEVVLPGHKPGLDHHPGWVAWARVSVASLETPGVPRIQH